MSSMGHIHTYSNRKYDFMNLRLRFIYSDIYIYICVCVCTFVCLFV